jgi:hypothetical protein
MQNIEVKSYINNNQTFPINAFYKTKLELFLKENNNKICFMYMSVETEGNEVENKLSHLAKVHAMIHNLADEIGYSFNDLKKIIKYNSGLYYYDENQEETLMSFGDCSNFQLRKAIFCCYDIANFIGMTLE